MLKSCQELIAATRQNISEVNWGDVTNKTEGVLIIDVREPAEVAARPVEGAINIPRGMLEFGIDGHPEIKHLGEPELLNTPVYVFCASGGRSALAAASLQSLGFNQVASISGGVNALK